MYRRMYEPEQEQEPEIDILEEKQEVKEESFGFGGLFSGFFGGYSWIFILIIIFFIFGGFGHKKPVYRYSNERE